VRTIFSGSPVATEIGRLVADACFLYAEGMLGQESQSLEELVRQHNVVDSPIAAMDLDTGMVLRFEGKLRIVISVFYESTESGPVVIVESVAGLEKFASDAQLDVWHINGEPFIVELPPEDFGTFVPRAGGGGSTPSHDAAGVVPVWRGPRRLN
jgi:hypothetical protein